MGSVEILLGPIRSGKTRRALAAYVELVKQGAGDRAVLLLPTARKVAHTRTSLVVDYNLPGLLGPRIMTFQDVVRHILDSTQHDAIPLSDIDRRCLLENIVSELSDAGELDYFQSVVRFPGFVDVIGQLISELKLCEVEPEQFLNAASRRGASAKDRAVAAIYSQYQKELLRRNVYDTEGGYWIATTIVRAGACAGFDLVELMVIDGFHTYTPAQLTLLQELARYVSRILFTLDCELAGDRQNVFATPERTLHALKRRFPQMKETMVDVRTPDSTVGMLGQQVFRKTRPGHQPSVRASGTIQIIEAPSELREVEEIAREAKRLIRESDCRADDIAVVFRTLDVYAPLVRDTFAEYGLPYWLGKGEPLSRNPVVKTVLAALDVRNTDWERDTVVQLVRSNYVKLAGNWSELVAERVERWACAAGILRGKTQWFDLLEKRHRALVAEGVRAGEDELLTEEEQRQEGQEQVRELDEVIAFVRELATAIEIIPDEATAIEHTRAISELVRRLKIKEAVLGAQDPELLRRDTTAYERFFEVLREMGEASVAQNPRSESLADFLARLTHVLESTELPEPHRTDGRIRVVDAYQARHHRFPVVFIGGLVEKVFPRQHDQDPLYNDAARGELKRHGVPLQDRGSKQSEEVFLFYNAIACATERIYFTYPATDAKGRYQMQSFYLKDVQDILDKDFKPRKLLRSEPVPETDAIWRISDLGQWLFNALWDRHADAPERDAARALYNCTAEKRLARVHRSIVSAFMEQRRHSESDPDEFDGVVNDDDVLQDIQRRFPPEFRFSPTALNDYGCCPFQYFCTRVLKLEPIEVPTEEVAPIDRGSLYHAILWRFYTELRQERNGETRFSQDERDTMIKRILRIARDEFARHEQTGFVGNPGLWNIEKRAIERNLNRFIAKELELRSEQDSRRPAYFELSFGSDIPPPRDARSVTAAFAVDGVQLTGKIDRVDVIEGSADLVVVDYKSGRTETSWSEVAQGTSFQLPVYWMACEELLFRDMGLQCAEACFYRLTGDYEDAIQRLRRTGDKWEEALAQCRAYIKDFADAIRAGRFPVMPSENCPSWCEYQDLCRYEPARIERKIEKQATQHRAETGPGDEP